MKSRIIKLNDKEYIFNKPVEVEMAKKILVLPYPKLRMLVSRGGVKFTSTPNRTTLIMSIDEITNLAEVYDSL